jgi:hypothetical protein
MKIENETVLISTVLIRINRLFLDDENTWCSRRLDIPLSATSKLFNVVRIYLLGARNKGKKRGGRPLLSSISNAFRGDPDESSICARRKERGFFAPGIFP